MIVLYYPSICVLGVCHAKDFICRRLRKQVSIMKRSPVRTHWLQNNNDRQPPRPGPAGRPNDPTAPRRPTTINRWLLLIVGVLLVVYVYNYFSNVNATNNAPPRLELSYNDFYSQINAQNVKQVTLIGQTDIQGEFNTAVHGYTTFHLTQLPNGDPQLPQLLISKGAQVVY